MNLNEPLQERFDRNPVKNLRRNGCRRTGQCQGFRLRASAASGIYRFLGVKGSLGLKGLRCLHNVKPLALAACFVCGSLYWRRHASSTGIEKIARVDLLSLSPRTAATGERTCTLGVQVYCVPDEAKQGVFIM